MFCQPWLQRPVVANFAFAVVLPSWNRSKAKNLRVASINHEKMPTVRRARSVSSQDSLFAPDGSAARPRANVVPLALVDFALLALGLLQPARPARSPWPMRQAFTRHLHGLHLQSPLGSRKPMNNFQTGHLIRARAIYHLDIQRTSVGTFEDLCLCQAIRILMLLADPRANKTYVSHYLSVLFELAPRLPW